MSRLNLLPHPFDIDYIQINRLKSFLQEQRFLLLILENDTNATAREQFSQDIIKLKKDIAEAKAYFENLYFELKSNNTSKLSKWIQSMYQSFSYFPKPTAKLFRQTRSNRISQTDRDDNEAKRFIDFLLTHTILPGQYALPSEKASAAELRFRHSIKGKDVKANAHFFRHPTAKGSLLCTECPHKLSNISNPIMKSKSPSLNIITSCNATMLL